MFLLFFFLLSCSDQNLNSSLSTNQDLTSLNSKQIELLKNDIEKSYSKERINVDEITSMKKVGAVSIFEYRYNGNKKGSIGLSMDNNFSVTDAYRLWCTGSCDCALEGIIDTENPENSYTQCRCSDCIMHFEIFPSTPNDRRSKLTNNGKVDIEKIASDSYFNTFGKKANNIKIDRIGIEKYEESYIYRLEYSEGELKSSVMYVTNYVFPNTEQSTAGEFTIDCTGSCDCRERFYPATGSIECTCSPCKMVVTPQTPPPAE